MNRNQRRKERRKQRLERKRLRKLQARRMKGGTAVPVSDFDSRSGRIKIADKWVDPEPYQGRPMEIWVVRQDRNRRR